MNLDLTKFTVVTEKPLVAHISFCPRCRGDHELSLKPLALAHDYFWAMCPQIKEPIIWELEREPQPVPEFDWSCCPEKVD